MQQCSETLTGSPAAFGVVTTKSVLGFSQTTLAHTRKEDSMQKMPKSLGAVARVRVKHPHANHAEKVRLSGKMAASALPGPGGYRFRSRRRSPAPRDVAIKIEPIAIGPSRPGQNKPPL